MLHITLFAFYRDPFGVGAQIDLIVRPYSDGNKGDVAGTVLLKRRLVYLKTESFVELDRLFKISYPQDDMVNSIESPLGAAP